MSALLPAVRELYSRHPKAFYLEPWELQALFWSLGYTEDLADEAEIAAAARWRAGTGRSGGRRDAFSFTCSLTRYTKTSEGSVMKTSVGQELDRLIEKRAQIGDAEARETLWKGSVRRYKEAIRQRNRAVAHFCQMATSHARVAQDYERRTEALCKEG